MKVISTKKPMREECHVCGALLEFDDTDIVSAINPYITCPECKSELMLLGDGYEDFIREPTKKDFVYPDDFFDFTSDKSVSNEEISCQIRRCIQVLDNAPDELIVDIATGNTVVIVRAYLDDNEYRIFVTKDYKELSVPIK